ncbi:MAG: hypothetical protein ACP5GI_04970 [Sulfolobales archaeon]
MSRVRVRFSILVGYISFTVRFFSAFLFTVFVVRYLSPQEFSVWVFGFSILPIVSMGYDLWGWAFARRYALGIKSSLSAAIILNLAYMFISSLALFFTSIYAVGYLGDPYRYLLVFIVNNVFNALSSLSGNLANVLRPDIGMSSMTVFELSRVLIAYVLVRVLGTGIIGAILSPALASAVSSLYVFYMLWRSNLIILSTHKVSSEIKTLLKMSILGLVDAVSRFLWNSDRVFLTIIAKATEAVSFLGVSYSLRGIISQVTSVPASVAYAKLLEEIRYSPRDVIYMIFLISSPVLIYSIVLSKPLVTLLNPVYSEMSSIVFLIMIDGFLSGLANVFTSIVYGLERRDLEAKTIKDLFKTSIGRIQVINFSRAILFGVGVLIYSMAIYASLLSTSPIQAIVVVSLLLLLPTSSYLTYVVKEVVSQRSLDIDLREISYMLFSALLSSIVFVATSAWRIEILSITRDVPPLIVLTIVALTIYIVILYFLSRWLRDFLSSILKYISAKIST